MTAAAQSTHPDDTVARVNPGELAPHPANPRKDLGDLTDLIASITAHGVLEPVVVVPAAAVAQAWPEHADQLDADDEYVTLLGHRRVAAAQAAMLDDVVVVVREDLTTAAAQLSAMTAENVARANLTALEEATAFHALAAQGWPQRRIAGELGCAQSHVSKRLKLLKLPEQLRDAIAAGELDVTDALKLGTLPDNDRVLAAWQRLQEEREDEFGDSTDVDYVVEWQQRQAEEAAQDQTARDKAASEGIEVIDNPRTRFGQFWWNHQLDDEESIENARLNGELVYSIGYAGNLVPYTTRTPDHLDAGDDGDDQASTSHVDDAREQRHATKAREQACPGLVAAVPATDQLLDVLARATLERETPDINAMKLAARWLDAAGVGPTVKDPHKWTAAMAEHSDSRLRAHAVWAGLVAAQESRTRAPYRHWNHRDVEYLEQLQAHGYEPTPWEQARLAEARRASQDADRLRLCPNLTCTRDTWHTGPCATQTSHDSTESAATSPDSLDNEEEA